jgi:hypothetical protein
MVSTKHLYGQFYRKVPEVENQGQHISGRDGHKTTIGVGGTRTARRPAHTPPRPRPRSRRAGGPRRRRHPPPSRPRPGGDGGGLRRLLPRRRSGPRRPDQRPGGRRLLQGLRPAPARPRAGGPQISSLSSPAPRRSYHGDLCSPATPVRFESQGAWSVRPSCSVGISSSLGLREPRFWIPRCSFWFMDGCRCIPLLPKESTLSYFSVLMLKCVLLLLP